MRVKFYCNECDFNVKIYSRLIYHVNYKHLKLLGSGHGGSSFRKRCTGVFGPREDSGENIVEKFSLQVMI